MGDGEWGALATDAELHCELCLSGDGRHVRLRRWLAGRDGEGERTGSLPLSS